MYQAREMDDAWSSIGKSRLTMAEDFVRMGVQWLREEMVPHAAAISQGD